MPGLKPRALLAFLACSAGKPQSRDKLIGLLCPVGASKDAWA
jgi:hypothetical protein